MAGAGGVKLGTRARPGEAPGVDPGPPGAFPGSSGRRGSRERGRGARREGTGSAPLRSRRLRSPGDGETGAQVPGSGARPGAWRLRGWRRRWQFGSRGLGAPRRTRSLRPPLSARAPQLSLPPGAPGRGRWAREPRGLGPRRAGTGSELSPTRKRAPGSRTPPLPPARCQAPRLSAGRRWEGRAGASTSVLLLAAGFFVPLARPGTCYQAFPAEVTSVPVWSVVSVLPVRPPLPPAAPGQVSTSELNTWRS